MHHLAEEVNVGDCQPEDLTPPKPEAGGRRAFTWWIRGTLVHPTFGPIGGEKKSLKSYLLTSITLGLATGVPIFDHFKVNEPAPVVVYVGEGGRLPYTRRLKRIASAMGVNLADVPLFSSFDVAPIGSQRFTESLERDLKREPGLVAYLRARLSVRGVHAGARPSVGDWLRPGQRQG